MSYKDQLIEKILEVLNSQEIDYLDLHDFQDCRLQLAERLAEIVDVYVELCYLD